MCDAQLELSHCAPGRDECGAGERKQQQKSEDVITQIVERSNGAEGTELGNNCENEGPASRHEGNVRAECMAVHIVIPALNEEPAIGGVLRALRRAGFADVVVVDNGSTDGTASVAEAEGARVIREPRKGYGAACLAGIAALSGAANYDVVLFMDADGSDDPADLDRILGPILDGAADLVIGSRSDAEPGALPAHARAGNAVACWLMRLRTGREFCDLGPLRALRYGRLQALGMQDTNFGWTVEMQLKALRAGMRVVEVPVKYRRRIGTSKISGTVGGSIRAGAKILWAVMKHGG